MSDISVLDYINSSSNSYILTPEIRQGLIRDADRILLVLNNLVDRIQTVKVRALTEDFQHTAEPMKDLPPTLQDLFSYIVTESLHTNYSNLKDDFTLVDSSLHSIAVSDKMKMRDILRISQWLSVK